MIFIVGQTGEIRAFLLAYRADAVIETGQSHTPSFIVHFGDQFGQHLGRIMNHTAIQPGVQVCPGSGDIDLEISQPAQAVGDGGHIDAHHTGIRIEGNIRLEQLRMFFEERLEILGADLLLAFEQELDIDRQLPAAPHQRFDRMEGGKHLSFHIGGAAPEQQLAAHLRLERSGLPELERIGGLDIIMSIDQHGRRARLLQVFAIDNRMPAVGGHDFHILDAESPQVGGHPFGGAQDFMVIQGIRRNGRDLQRLCQIGQESILVLLGILKGILNSAHCSS